MVKNLPIVSVIICAIINTVCSRSVENDRELIFVTALWRHGERAIDRDFDGNLYTPSFWANGLNQLTQHGIAQQVQLGRWLRARYVDNYALLPPRLADDAILVESTVANRTKESALHHLRGLFDEPLTYADFRLHYPHHGDHDIVGYPYTRCAYAEALAANAFQTEAVQEFVNNNMWYIILTKALNITPTKIEHIFDFADPLYVEKLQGLKLAPKYEDYWDDIFEAYLHAFKLHSGIGISSPLPSFSYRDELTKMHCGRILEKMVHLFKWKADCNETPPAWPPVPKCEVLKYKAFSLHDTYLLGVLATMGFAHLDVDRDDNVKMGACLVWELWKNPYDNSTAVKIIYRRDAEHIFHLSRRMEGCGPDGCPLHAYLKSLKKYAISNQTELRTENAFVRSLLLPYGGIPVEAWFDWASNSGLCANVASTVGFLVLYRFSAEYRTTFQRYLPFLRTVEKKAFTVPSVIKVAPSKSPAA